jgi:hypothetical protein
MGLSFFVSSVHQYRDELFIDGMYCSVIIAAVIGMFSARAAAFLSLTVGLILFIMVLATSEFHKDSTIAQEFIWALIWRPFLAALFLFLLPPVGPLGRSLLRKIRHSVSQ